MYFGITRGRFVSAGIAALLAVGPCGQAVAEAMNMDALAERASGTIERLHENAHRALVTAAQDRAFEDYFHTHDHAERAEIKSRIDDVSLAVQEQFHVEEMCLIDPQGAEISRIVGSEIAHDLATDEADAVFFTPGFETEHRQVYISPIYLSPDANKWVIAYVTPVLVEGDKRSILHYEHALTAYTDPLQRQADRMDGDLIVVANTEHVIFDSRHDIPIDATEGQEARGDYFEIFDLGGHDLASLKRALGQDDMAGAGRITGTEGTYDVAFRMVGRWTIIAWQAV